MTEVAIMRKAQVEARFTVVVFADGRLLIGTDRTLDDEETRLLSDLVAQFQTGTSRTLILTGARFVTGRSLEMGSVVGEQDGQDRDQAG